ncbi:MAG: PepSY domain-containing protein [Lachnospiraceae bacterium]|nr:PepSY domain-containing protein [Lachnospiraceae bacterium]
MNIRIIKQITAMGLALALGVTTACTAYAIATPEYSAVQAAKTKIGKKKARNIALKDAGFKKKNVKYLTVKLDYEDDYATDIYEIEFTKGRKEYSYDINAYTGEILDKDVDYDD